jgi:regulatory protein
LPRSGRSTREVRPVTARTLENAAARYVERFGGTTKRLRTVLRRRVDAAPEKDTSLYAVIDAIVARYTASGMIDDAAFAASRANRLVRRGVSPGVIRGRLSAEGLDGTAALAEVEGDATLRSACALVRRRRLGAFGTGGEGDLGKLARAGFSYDTAKKVLAMTQEEVDAVVRG